MSRSSGKRTVSDRPPSEEKLLRLGEDRIACESERGWPEPARNGTREWRSILNG